MRLSPCFVVVFAAILGAQSAPRLPAEALLDRTVLTALDEELSGVAAKDHVGRLMHKFGLRERRFTYAPVEASAVVPMAVAQQSMAM